ncbi:hypothetical protein DFR58_10457 [Anaerobacterium chartisolvens]|uniref:Uncharacterized protein n=1 Tax=Anaerobacterium chartisolvens TaxID=1297424 RepID=A0A369BDV7_9FIRM|nr:hypothetical protein [Anaerobacterium chartisolvens]RCX18788.1 hypothetical protein DFR58_10457 [Anaerobacterium chartisolvens]
MSDDMSKKIKEIAEMLGQENMPDNVKGIINLLAGSAGQGQSQERKSNSSDEDSPVASSKEQSRERSDMDENIEMLRKVKTIMDRLNSTNDPRVNLLTAVKPFLSSKRQQKLGTCIRMIQMTGLTRLMEGSDKSSL